MKNQYSDAASGGTTGANLSSVAHVALSARESCPRWLELTLIGVLVIYGLLVWVWGMGRLDVAHSMEALRAVGARTMVRTGDYLIPQVGESVNLRKPPLFYWLAALASRLYGGATEAAVRLPSALCAIATLLMLYFAMRPVFGWMTAYIAGVIGATLPMVLPPATVGDVNMLLALGVAISLLAAFHIMERPRHGWFYAVLCGIGIAIGMMAKMPIGLLFFAPTLLLYWGYRSGGRLATDWRWSLGYMAAMAVLFRFSMWSFTRAGLLGALLYVVPVGMLLYFGLRGTGDTGSGWHWVVVAAAAVLLSGIWPVLASERLGLDTLWDVFKKEAWQTRSVRVGVSNQGHVWLYIVALPLEALPWTFFIPLAFLRRYDVNASDREKRMLLFAQCWLIGSMVLFTVISPARKVRYLLPVFPALCLLAADVYVRSMRGMLQERLSRYVRVFSRLIVYACCLAPFFLAGLWFGMKLPISSWTAVAVAAACLGAAAGAYLHKSDKTIWAPLASVALVFLSVAVFLHFGYSQIENERESPRVACERIRSGVPAGERLYLCGDAPPEVIYYLDAELPKFGEKTLNSSHAFVCIVAQKRSLPKLPSGYHYEELDRVRSHSGELILFRAEAAH